LLAAVGGVRSFFPLASANHVLQGVEEEQPSLGLRHAHAAAQSSFELPPSLLELDVHPDNLRPQMQRVVADGEEEGYGHQQHKQHHCPGNLVRSTARGNRGTSRLRNTLDLTNEDCDLPRWEGAGRVTLLQAFVPLVAPDQMDDRKAREESANECDDH